MAIKTENTAPGSAVIDPYSPENLLYYHVSLGLVEHLYKRGVLSYSDLRQACKLLTKKYGLPKNSIFAEVF